MDDAGAGFTIRDPGDDAERCVPPHTPERGTAYGKLRVFSVNDLDTATARGYLLKGIISPAEISLWVGPPKCGKSFLLLHLSYMLSLGRQVFGRRVHKANVLYLAAEGESGIANRIRALRDRYGPSDAFHFIAQPADLLHQDGHLADLEKAVEAYQADLVVLDTLSRVLAGGDENSSVDMGLFIKNVAQLRHTTKAHVAIVHHGTKGSNGSTPRGHGSLTGADDALIEVVKLDDGTRTATLVHAKDDVDGFRVGFTLDAVDLGTDEDGDAITTLLVTETAQAAAAPDRSRSLSHNEQIGLACLDKAYGAESILATVGDDNQERPVVRESDWRRWFYSEAKPGESQANKRQAFKRAVDGLLAKKRVTSRHDFVWRPEWR